MAIEIKELYIRVSVNALLGAPSPRGETTAAGGNAPAERDEEREALVAACVEQVMQLLRDKTER
jgi:hypothetical protein